MLIRRSGRVLNDARGHRCTFPECAVAGYQSGKETHHFLDATRFFNEARASNLASHTSIVDVYELGQLPDGRAYIVMQFLAGDSLADRLQQRGGKLPAADAIRLIRQVAAGMAAAHSKGIIHRELPQT